jgi:hypothetical protein
MTTETHYTHPGDHAPQPLALKSNAVLGPTPRWWHCDTHGPAKSNAWGCPECVRELRKENRLLRRLLAIRVAGALLYTDDGELSDATAAPAIDFRRDPAEQIEAALMERNRRKAKDDAYWGTRPVLGA